MIKELIYSIESNPITNILLEMKSALSYIWNYKIYDISAKESIMVGSVIISVFLLAIGFRAAKNVSRKFAEKLPSRLEKSTLTLLETLVYYLLLAIIVIIALDIAHVPLTAFTVIGSTIALGIGLGTQHMANNFISGLLILFEQPIKIGDVIELKNMVGEVISIGTRCVKIKTQSNMIMLIPNSEILQGVVINWTHNDKALRYTLVAEISNEAKLTDIDEILKNSFLSHKLYSKSKKEAPLLVGVRDFSYIMEINIWIKIESDNSIKQIINEMNREFVEECKKSKINILRLSFLDPTEKK